MRLFGKRPIRLYTFRDQSGLIRTFHLFQMSERQKERFKRNIQNQEAHLRNSNWSGWLTSFAEMAAILLTPAGSNPEKKDIDALREEILDLPLRFVAEVINDVFETGMAQAKARNKR
jgi:hypothetical protein